MASFTQPAKGRLRQFTLAGVDLTGYVQCVQVYESLLKPYLTAHITIIDNNNVIENLQIVGGEPSTILFDSPPNNQVTYSCTLYVLSLSGQQSPNNLKTQIYELDLIGMVYFQDKANLVQKGFGQQTGTDAIASIWKQYLGGDALNILQSSLGFIGSQNDPSTIENQKPFAAIDQIKKMLVFPGNTSLPMLFRNNKSVNLASLPYLFSSMSPTQQYIQKETWGANFFDPMIYNAIISAHTMVTEVDGTQATGGRSSLTNIVEALNQGQVAFDMFTGTIAKNLSAISASASSMSGTSIGSLINGLGMASGGLGGRPNIQATHSNRWDNATAPFNKTIQEAVDAATINNGPMLQIKVPLQTGLFATVGSGVGVQLVPPFGDLTNGNAYTSQLSGNWLVKNLVHEVYCDDREVTGTTSMELVRGGLNI